jgi:hypothetical protein
MPAQTQSAGSTSSRYWAHLVGQSTRNTNPTAAQEAQTGRSRSVAGAPMTASGSSTHVVAPVAKTPACHRVGVACVRW